MTWRIASEFGCSPMASDEERYKTKATICYQEVAVAEQQDADGLHPDKTRYVLRDIGALEMGGKAKAQGTGQQPPPIGVSKCEWSGDSRFLAVVSDASSRVVWIWDLKYLLFHSILAHKASVRAIAWNAVGRKLQQRPSVQLAISCNNDRLYLWSKSGAVVIRVVASRFNVRRLSWRPTAGDTAKQKEKRSKSKKSKYQNLASKDCICLIDRNHFCA